MRDARWKPVERAGTPECVFARDDTVEVFRARFRVDDESVARDAPRVGVT
jgi:hypothetical protein